MQADISESQLKQTQVVAAAEMLAEALRQDQPFIVLIDERGLDMQAVSDLLQTVFEPATRFFRIANPLAAPLTPSRILFQIGAETAESPQEEAADIVRLLTEGTSAGARVLLMIEQADTLTAEASCVIQKLPAMALSDGAILQVVFIAGPDFLGRTENEALARLCRPLRGAPVVPVTEGEPEASAVPTGRALATSWHVGLLSPFRTGDRWRHWRLLMVALVAIPAIVATAVNLAHRDAAPETKAAAPVPDARRIESPQTVAQSAPSSIPVLTGTGPSLDVASSEPSTSRSRDTRRSETPAPITATPGVIAPGEAPRATSTTVSTATAPTPPPTATTALEPTAALTPPVAEPVDPASIARASLRRDFAIFLSRMRPELTVPQREALFQQYLARRKLDQKDVQR
jgi:hypothetical protein